MHCKLCRKTFELRESRHKLKDEITLRLINVGVIFKENETESESESICRVCFREIGAVEKAEAIKDKWLEARTTKKRRIQRDFTVDVADVEQVSVLLFIYFFGVDSSKIARSARTSLFEVRIKLIVYFNYSSVFILRLTLQYVLR